MVEFMVKFMPSIFAVLKVVVDLMYSEVKDIELKGIGQVMGLKIFDPRGFVMEDVELKGVRLKGVGPIGVGLKGVELRGAGLKGVGLKGVELKGVELRGVRLEITTKAEPLVKQQDFANFFISFGLKRSSF